jgi:hypothetical protein
MVSTLHIERLAHHHHHDDDDYPQQEYMHAMKGACDTELSASKVGKVVDIQQDERQIVVVCGGGGGGRKRLAYARVTSYKETTTKTRAVPSEEGK